MISEKKGLRIDMESANLEDFRFVPILYDSYMTFDKPLIVLTKLRKYGENYKLTENHEMLIEIIKNTCVLR